ncbi:MAG: hypothetical protein JSS16_12410 [Proteobacteria bacterium]|uniref:hypothetical protein n=1 Tax=Rudaea sp. TaxID=2136325 RepID=UPI001E085A9F|nr:hypothetical protein [Pseudomonadota bacterium]MBS0567050.1 hypothetical protein [Pseudomonadota bacterium]
MNKLSKRIPLTIVLAGAVALAACGKKEAPAPAPAPAPAAAAPAPAPAPAPAAPAQVNSVVLGNAVDASGKISAPVGSFATKDTIYATVALTTTVPNLAVNLRWKFQDGQTVADNAKTIAEPSTGTIDDKLTKASGWPVGNYTLEVVSDGKTLSTTSFQVK